MSSPSSSAAPAPLLIVVTGMPAAGKTTVAGALAHELALPLVAKDDIKERLYDTLGTGEVEWSQRLGAAAYSLIFGVATEVLAARQPLIVEANFFRGGHEEQFRALPRHRLVQICCQAPLEVLVERFISRGRHTGHLDRERAGELAGRLESGVHSLLALSGPVLKVNTGRRLDAIELADRIRPLLRDDALATIPAP